MVLALCLSLRAQAFHSPARALEAELRPKLAHVRYGSREFDQVLKKTLPKYQVSVDRSVSVFQWRPNLGPSPIRVAQIQLELAALNEDESWDDANFAFWPSRSGTNVQFLDGFTEVEKSDPSSILDSEEYRDGDRLIRCGAATQAGNRSWPGARVYRLRGNRWQIVKTEEREHPFGSASFTRRSGHAHRPEILAETWDSPKHLMAAMSGPALNYRQTWYIRGFLFKRGKLQIVPSATAELDRLAGLAQSNQRSKFDVAVPPIYRKRLWTVLRERRQVERATEKVECDAFKIDAWPETPLATVYFKKRSGEWRLTSAKFRR